MDGKELIGYCRIHCETPRALFSSDQVNKMIALAGYPKNFPRSIDKDRWVSVHEEMAELCDLATVRLDTLENAPVPDNVVQLFRMEPS